MEQLTDYEKKALRKFEESIIKDQWSNEALVQLVELCGQYLNLLSIPQYADQVGKSYNCIKKTKQITIILKHKYIIENE